MDQDPRPSCDSQATLPHIAAPFDEMPTRVMPREAIVPIEEPDGLDADVDTDDDEEAEFVEPFSLLKSVVCERFGPAGAEERCAVEVIHYQGAEIVDLLRADPGRRVCIGPDAFCLLEMELKARGRGATLFFRRDFGGTLVTRGRARPLSALADERFVVGHDKQSPIYAVQLHRGDYAQVLRGGSGYLVRFVRPPSVRQPCWRPRLSWQGLQLLAGSATVHLLALVLLGFAAPEAELTVPDETEVFARGVVRPPTLEGSRQPEPPEAKPVPQDKPVRGPERPVRLPNVFPKKPKAGSAKSKLDQNEQVGGVLKALENIRPAGAGTGAVRSDLSALTSNISALRLPQGNLGGFKVSGLIGKAGGGVKLAMAGTGGGTDTRPGSQILDGTGVGTLQGVGGVGTRPVLGRVKRPPRRAIVCDGGVLSKAAIQAVINRHMREVQHCYEVELLKRRDLAGTIVFDWTISPRGDLVLPRQASSTMASPAVASCVLRRMRAWRFPSPRGGPVRVRYPFVFRAREF